MVIQHAAQLEAILRPIIQATQAIHDGDFRHEARELSLPTSRDLSKLTGLNLETVKKRLRSLMSQNIIQAVGFSPKHYRYNPYALRELPEDHEFYALLLELTT